MDRKRYEDVLRRLNSLKTNHEKVAYLDSVIEFVDNDRNGFNEELVELRNKLNQ